MISQLLSNMLDLRPERNLQVVRHTANAPREPSALASVFSVDVEDWFHILQLPGAPDISAWDSLPSCVEVNFRRLLDLFDKHRVRVTCFFLGWVAQRFPGLVRDAQRRGHEVASHGYAHRLVFELTQQEFLQDSLRSRLLLEDIVGAPVRGYRAAGFSLTSKTEWFFETLLKAGYSYDSSVFPATRQHGGLSGGRREPYRLLCDSGMLTEFPISVTNLFGTAVCLFGGGYLRFFPYWLIRRKSREVLSQGRPVVFYIHPREIDCNHPRLPMPLVRRWKCYVNLHTTQPKIEQILADFPLATFAEFLSEHGRDLPIYISSGKAQAVAADCVYG